MLKRTYSANLQQCSPIAKQETHFQTPSVTQSWSDHQCAHNENTDERNINWAATSEAAWLFLFKSSSPFTRNVEENTGERKKKRGIKAMDAKRHGTLLKWFKFKNNPNRWILSVSIRKLKWESIAMCQKELLCKMFKMILWSLNSERI